MLLIILLVIVLISLTTMIVIVSKHMPHLAAVDLVNLPKEKASQMKQKIIEMRIKRKFGSNINTFHAKYLVPIFTKVKAVTIKTYDKAIQLEKQYKKETKIQKADSLPNQEKQDAIKSKVSKAFESLENNELKEAEELFIDIITLEPKNIDAYLGLAITYRTAKDFDHAKEIYQHILKIEKENSEALNGLAKVAIKQNNRELANEIYENLVKLYPDNSVFLYEHAVTLEYMGEVKKALEACQKAVDLKQNDPKYLDCLINLSIVNNKKYLALKALDKLKDVNPDNQKLDEFKKRIGEI
jgi:tetratricopeptide (TPR) repeat protein